MNVSVYCPELNMTFQTISDAAKYTGAARSNIQQCLRGKRHTAGKHKETNQNTRHMFWVILIIVVVGVFYYSFKHDDYHDISKDHNRDNIGS